MSSLVNISIDDVSPHPLSSTKVLDQCFEMIKHFPDIKFTLFIPVAYWRTMRKDIATKEPLRIDVFPDFCKKISSLPDKNFEIGYHGLFHGIPGKSDNDEMENLDYEQSKALIQNMVGIIENAGLKHLFKPIIRPPAWRMSPDAIKAFRDAGFKILALNPLEPWVSTYKEEHLKKNDVVYCTATPPFKPLTLIEKTEIVYHACEWDKNYLDRNMTASLLSFLNENKEKIEFSFMDGFISG
jgi:predicted deacetylase